MERRVVVWKRALVFGLYRGTLIFKNIYIYPSVSTTLYTIYLSTLSVCMYSYLLLCACCTPCPHTGRGGGCMNTTLPLDYGSICHLFTQLFIPIATYICNYLASVKFSLLSCTSWAFLLRTILILIWPLPSIDLSTSFVTTCYNWLLASQAET